MYLKKLTAEELANTPRRKNSRKHHVYVAIEELKKGEALMISREAFSWQNKTPNLFCKKICKKGRKRFTVAHNVHGTGWIV